MELCTLRACKRSRTNEEETDYWSSLPAEILDLIAGKIRSIEDYVMFVAVCRSWDLTASEFKNKPSFGPLYVCGIEADYKTLTLGNPATDTRFVLDLPDTVGKYFWGSPFGWLISLDCKEVGSGIHGWKLFNPFTGAIIPLPSLPGVWSRGSTVNPLLTANPDSDPDNYLAVIYSSLVKKLAFTKPGRTGTTRRKWSFISMEEGSDFSGITYFRGNLCGILSSDHRPLQIVSFQLTPNRHYHSIVPLLTLNQSPYDKSYLHYLFELNGQLCLCVRLKVFKINLSTRNLAQLPSLEGHCLFLDRNYSFAWKISYPPARIDPSCRRLYGLFEQPRHPPQKFLSNYIFYHIRFSSELEVWDMLYSVSVGTHQYYYPPVKYPPFPSFWILPFI